MRDFFQRYVLHNLALKLIALVSAVLLWSAVSREPVVETAYSVPVELHQVPPNLEITTSGIPLAQVRLRGPERRIRQLTAADVHPIISLAGSGTGEHTYDLTASQVRVPYGMEVVQVTPSEIRIGFDHSLVRQIEIHPRITGRLEKGSGVLRVTTDPTAITVIGPQAHVQAATTAITDPIDITGVRGSATFTTNAYVPDPLVRELKPEQIHVTVVTGQISGEDRSAFERNHK
ncbi:MAG TPA: CdaR family protein [Terriglobales bacterium]|nr:CdaR family protein [Terriglobales bacterium]